MVIAECLRRLEILLVISLIVTVVLIMIIMIITMVLMKRIILLQRWSVLGDHGLRWLLRLSNRGPAASVRSRGSCATTSLAVGRVNGVSTPISIAAL
jgi:hypothetical protein